MDRLFERFGRRREIEPVDPGTKIRNALVAGRSVSRAEHLAEAAGQHDVQSAEIPIETVVRMSGQLRELAILDGGLKSRIMANYLSGVCQGMAVRIARAEGNVSSGNLVPNSDQLNRARKAVYALVGESDLDSQK